MAELLRHFFPNNPSFGFEALRAAGYSTTGGADIAEVIAICSKIRAAKDANIEDAWLREWRVAADRAAVNANVSLAKGNKPSARDAFLRATNYYRTAEFYRRDNPFEDEISQELTSLSGKMFWQAMNLVPYSVVKVKIPYEGTTLPGILMRPSGDENSDGPQKRPTLIVNNGYDSTSEESCCSFGPAFLELGFNVLAFDGPGQGEAIREQRLFFRHDWEKVITPVVDYLVDQPFVDEKKIVLLGISMGGYLVARAAAFDHRLALLVLNNGLFDFGKTFSSRTPGFVKSLIAHKWDSTVNKLVQIAKPYDIGLKWGINNGVWVFGLKSEADVLRAAEKYTLEGIADKIKTPTLVLDAPDDHFMKGQPKEIFDRLKCDKELVALTREEGGSMHCHVGATARLGQVIGDWIMERLSKI